MIFNIDILAMWLDSFGLLSRCIFTAAKVLNNLLTSNK